VAVIHGKDGVFYLQGSGAEAVPLSNRSSWSIDIASPKAMAAHQGDEWQAAARGALGFSGAVAGSLDAASDILWQAGIATSGRKAYFYPDKGTSARYYYGTIWPDLSVSSDAGAIETYAGAFTGSGQLAQN
jgi:hypothetical protein